MSEQAFILWVDPTEIRYADTFIKAFELKAKYGGCIYEPLGMDVARQINELEPMQAEIERLGKMHVYCNLCGGTWLDDGLTSGCRCLMIQSLKDEIERLKNQTCEWLHIIYGSDTTTCETSCANVYENKDDCNPCLHAWIYCPACGGKIVVKPEVGDEIPG